MRTHYLTILSALFLINCGSAAKAEEISSNISGYQIQQNNQNSHLSALEKQLDAIGINSSEVKEFIQEINKERKNNGFNFYQDAIPGGKLSLRYQLNTQALPGETTKMPHLQLNYKPEFDERLEITAGKGHVMATWKFKFN